MSYIGNKQQEKTRYPSCLFKKSGLIPEKIFLIESGISSDLLMNLQKNWMMRSLFDCVSDCVSSEFNLLESCECDPIGDRIV
jgi:hypothetical protein